MKAKSKRVTAVLFTVIVCFTNLAVAASTRVDANGNATADVAVTEAAENAPDLAKELANPISSLISVPFQANEDFGYGPTGDGYKFTLNIQPVIPFSLSKDWNLILRTIFPVVSQHDLFYDPALPESPASHKIVRRMD